MVHALSIWLETFAAVLGRAVKVEIVPRESREPLFRAQGARNPLPRIRMLDGFNGGWIEFQDQGRLAMKGPTTIEIVIAQLVDSAKASGEGPVMETSSHQGVLT